LQFKLPKGCTLWSKTSLQQWLGLQVAWLVP
jgi:hypothetical protein